MAGFVGGRFAGARGREFPNVDEEESGPWVFVQLADSQLGLLNMATSPDEWSAEMACLEVAVEKINALRPAPKFVVVCGDLINEFPASSRPGSDAERGERQTRDFKAAVSKVSPSIPLVCVCGNHDVGDVPSRATIDLFASRFGEDYGQFRCCGGRCLVLNSQLYSAMECEANAEALEMAKEQESWLLNVHTDPREDVLVFSHIPPFLFDEDEPKGYFNIAPDVRRGLLASVGRLAARRKAWFCGHFHRNAGGWTKDRALEVVVTSAVGTAIGWNDDASGAARLGIEGMDWTKRACQPDTSGLRLVCVHPVHGIRHKFFTLDQCPTDLRIDDLEDWEGRPPTDDITPPSASCALAEDLHHPEAHHPMPHVAGPPEGE